VEHVARAGLEPAEQLVRAVLEVGLEGRITPELRAHFRAVPAAAKLLQASEDGEALRLLLESHDGTTRLLGHEQDALVARHRAALREPELARCAPALIAPIASPFVARGRESVSARFLEQVFGRPAREKVTSWSDDLFALVERGGAVPVVEGLLLNAKNPEEDRTVELAERLSTLATQVEASDPLLAGVLHHGAAWRWNKLEKYARARVELDRMIVLGRGEVARDRLFALAVSYLGAFHAAGSQPDPRVALRYLLVAHDLVAKERALAQELAGLLHFLHAAAPEELNWLPEEAGTNRDSLEATFMRACARCLTGDRTGAEAELAAAKRIDPGSQLHAEVAHWVATH
jgi:hypothetical protein